VQRHQNFARTDPVMKDIRAEDERKRCSMSSHCSHPPPCPTGSALTAKPTVTTPALLYGSCSFLSMGITLGVSSATVM